MYGAVGVYPADGPLDRVTKVAELGGEYNKQLSLSRFAGGRNFRVVAAKNVSFQEQVQVQVQVLVAGG